MVGTGPILPDLSLGEKFTGNHFSLVIKDGRGSAFIFCITTNLDLPITTTGSRFSIYDNLHFLIFYKGNFSKTRPAFFINFHQYQAKSSVEDPNDFFRIRIWILILFFRPIRIRIQIRIRLLSAPGLNPNACGYRCMT